MQKQQTFKNNQLVWVKPEGKSGRIKGLTRGVPVKYRVEIITNYNKETKERTTKMLTLGVEDLESYRKPKPKKYNPNEMWYMVRDFQKAFGHPAPDKPTMLTTERILKRNSWMLEECNEMLEAETLEDQVDAAIDKLYFAIGDLVELGVKPFNLFKIVQEANMGKLWNIDGKLIPQYKEDGKVKKPPQWEEKYAPEKRLKEEIKRQSK